MTDQDDKTAATDNRPDQPASKTGKPARRKARRRRSGRPSLRRWLTPLLVLILVAALGGGGYYWGYPVYQSLLADWQGLQQRQASLEQTVTELRSRLDSAERARQALADRAEADRDELERMMVETAQRLSRRDDLEADRWPLEEALALLRLAERRLQLDANADIALRLLDAADQVLAGLNEAAVLPVRRQIARDRLALESVEAADVSGLYFRLEAIDERLAALEWSPQARIEPEPRSEQEADSAWRAFRDSLDSLVTVTRLETAHRAPPLLDDFSLWRQRARLLLEQLQLALLAGEQPLFDAAREQLNEQLAMMQTDLELDALRSELDDLADTRLNPDLPDIGTSVEALEAYLSRTDEPAEDATAPGGDNG